MPATAAKIHPNAGAGAGELKCKGKGACLAQRRPGDLSRFAGQPGPAGAEAQPRKNCLAAQATLARSANWRQRHHMGCVLSPGRLRQHTAANASGPEKQDSERSQGKAPRAAAVAAQVAMPAEEQEPRRAQNSGAGSKGGPTMRTGIGQVRHAKVMPVTLVLGCSLLNATVEVVNPARPAGQGHRTGHSTTDQQQGHV